MDAVKIVIKTGSIGPSHDPYGYEEIIVTRGSHVASWYSDGLGSVRVKMWDAKDPPVQPPTHEYSWVDDSYVDKAWRVTKLKAKLRFRQWVGLDKRTAWEQYNMNYEPDPYGSASRYI